jgi:hypothetical protein
MEPDRGSPFSASEIQEEIRAVTHSGVFTQSSRHTKLLGYLCNKVLLGTEDEIKESTIALEVFDRPPSFDDKKDAIVRVEAHRLRQRLAKYYATEGAHDRLIIELVPGGYVPKFVKRAPEIAPSLPPAPAEPAPPPNRFQLTPALIVTLAALAAVLVAGPLLLARRNAGHPVAAPASDTHPAAAAVANVDGIRILAGSQKPYTDRAGRLWRADEYFKGGTSEPGPADFPGRPPDPRLYRSMRYGDFEYDIPAGDEDYELRLYFAEPTFRNGMDVGNEGGENQRHFTVTANGEELLHDFDVACDSGRSPVDVRAFSNIRPAHDGVIHLRFQAVVGPPFVNAIELVPGIRGHVRPIRIRAGDSSYTDRAGNLWSPDTFYAGGRLATHKGDVLGTPDPELYAGERYGNFSYAIPVPPGRYAVTLYFAETYWDPQGDSTHKGGPGARVFDVSANGLVLLPAFDMLAVAKPLQPIVRTFHNLRPDGLGKLQLSFAPIANYASVKAIEVTEEPPSTAR